MQKKYTVLFIPAGGLKTDGSLPTFVRRRLDSAINVYKKIKKQRYLFVLSGRETLYKNPVLDREGFPIIESYVMAQYLIDNGIEKNIIRTEKFSMDTVGSIYLSKKLIIDYLPVTKIIVFTSDFLLEKTKLSFKWIFGFKENNKVKFIFKSIPSEDIEKSIRQARFNKEVKILKRITKVMKDVVTEEQFNTWLFTQHAGYTYGLKILEIDKKLKETY